MSPETPGAPRRVRPGRPHPLGAGRAPRVRDSLLGLAISILFIGLAVGVFAVLASLWLLA